MSHDNLSHQYNYFQSTYQSPHNLMAYPNNSNAQSYQYSEYCSVPSSGQYIGIALNQNSGSFEDSGYDSTLSSIERQSFGHSTPEQISRSYYNSSYSQSQTNEKNSSFLEPLAAFSPTSIKTKDLKEEYEENYFTEQIQTSTSTTELPAVEKESKLLKKKKHQRIQDQNRTRALNQAFCKLRTCLPEIPKDTKLTKIRTLRYAISYIKELMILTGNQENSSTSSSLDTHILMKNIQDCEDQLLMENDSVNISNYY